MQKNQFLSPKQLVLGGICAALYVALTAFLAPISFGQIQIRVSEALYAVALFSPVGIGGVTLGCFLSNLFFSPFGLIDVVLGTLGSFLGATLVYLLRSRRQFAFFWPVVTNAIAVAIVLQVAGEVPFVLGVLYTGVGQTIAIYGVGTTLAIVLQKYIFGGERPILPM